MRKESPEKRLLRARHALREWWCAEVPAKQLPWALLVAALLVVCVLVLQ